MRTVKDGGNIWWAAKKLTDLSYSEMLEVAKGLQEICTTEDIKPVSAYDWADIVSDWAEKALASKST
jgi:hypothetical protein